MGGGSNSRKINVFELNDINFSACNTIVDSFRKNIDLPYSQKTEVEIKNSSQELKKIIDENPNSPIVLKMDIEGAEYDCIKNLYENDLLKQIDIIIFEWHFNGYDSIVELLENNDFVWFNEQFNHKVGLIRAVNIKKCFKKR